MTVYQEKDFSISHIGFEDDFPSHCLLKLNAVTFGYATNTIYTFYISYDDSVGNWNFEKPPLATYYGTPRQHLKTIDKQDFANTPPEMPMGYTSENMREFNTDFPDRLHRISWDYPVTNIRPDYAYIHPSGHRFLLEEELAAINGCQPGEIPDQILDYLERHIDFFSRQAWGSQDFEARFDGCAQEWQVTPVSEKRKTKVYDFSQYTPRLCPPCSDRYPLKKAKIPRF